VVEDFLRMARQKPVELRDCSIREELETIVTLVAKDAQNRGITLRLEPYEEEAIVRGDGEKLRQAFLNIVINALQATPSGGRVSIVLDRVGTGFKITFRDSGSGIAADNLQRIFEPFYTTKSDGTGLGLAVTRKIIEGHGGKMDIESKEGQGTTVSVSLPLLAGGES
jgi:signal transduction histidine kinase